MNGNVEIIKESLTLREVMEFYGVRFNSRGFARCPFHAEKTASLSIKNEHYKCFGCGEYGGIIDFVMKYFNLTFKQSIAKIGSDFGLPLDFKTPTYRERQRLAEEMRIRREQKAAEELANAKCRNNYLALCDLHRMLFKSYVQTDDLKYKKLASEISDILDDFTGKEAMLWTQEKIHSAETRWQTESTRRTIS